MKKQYFNSIDEMKVQRIRNSKKRENRQILLKESGFVSLQDAKKSLQMTNAKADVVYNVLMNMYNQQADIVIENIKKNKAKVKYQEKKLADRTYNYKKDLNALLLDNKQFETFFKKEESKKKPIYVTFISRVLENVKRSITFKNYFHFENWLSMNQEEITDYDGDTISIHMLKKEVFDKFIVDIEFIKGGKFWGENKKDVERKINFNDWECIAFDPATSHTGDNNCGIRVISRMLNLKLNSNEIRKQLNLQTKALLSTNDLVNLYTLCKGKKTLKIIDENYEDEFDLETTDYILYKDYHYTYIIKATKQIHKDTGKKKQKGTLVFDIETRETEEVVKIGKNISKLLRSAILSVVYKPVRAEKKIITFTTDKNKNCCIKFLDWLSFEAHSGRFYNCIAHNGSRFDFYLLLSYFNQELLFNAEVQLRGTSIIGFQYKSHTFKDSCCFLTDSLSNLCDGYLITPEEKAFSKKTDIQLGDKTITNYQLCFYKPELTFWEFMELEEKEPEFWTEYVKYCEYDCESLFLVWTKFKSQVENVIFKIGNWLPKYVSINTCNTIGSLAMKILNCVNGNRRGQFHTKPFKKYSEFMCNDDKVKAYDTEKYNFICKFKRGGISHTNQLGLHKEGICGVDIKSQYPTALKNMKIPSGKSKWVKKYDENYIGYYHINNMKWSDDAKTFKPIASVKDNGVLDWANPKINNVYVDSYMLKYLMKNCGLISFGVIDGLVSFDEIDGSELFGAYVNTLYEEKAKQDELKNKKHKDYNKPYREVIKLFLNSLTGKLVEDQSKYGALCFTDKDAEKGQKSINGTTAFVDKTESFDKINEWVNAGVMVYSYSKRNIWEYINCLPNKADDVIQVETDGLYFGLPHRKKFMENLSLLNDPIIRVGDNLGNIEEEVNTTEESFYLGKKDYMIGLEKYMTDGKIDYNKSKIRYKGIPKSTIDDEGTGIDLLNRQFYIDRYNGKTVEKSFKTISKILYGNKQTNNINLSGFNMTRKATPHDFKKFKVYYPCNDDVIVKDWEKYN